MSENDEFIREFLDECEENLDQLDKDLVALEQNPRDSERLESIFRTIHTIKGTSGFFSFAKLGALAHDGESLLGRLRDGELILNQEIVSALLELMDAIRNMLGSIAENGTEGTTDHGQLSAKLIRLALSSGTPAIAEPTSTPPASDSSEDESIEATVSNSSVPDVPDPQLGLPPDELTATLSATPASDTASAEPVEPSVEPSPLLSSTPQAASSGESPPSSGQGSPTSSPRDTAKASPSEGSIRVDVRLLDELMDLAGELVLARNELNQFSDAAVDAPLGKAIQRLGQITSELQGGVMQTRMQPIATIWRKFPRLLRDLAVACDKEIELVQAGAETELDRSLLEAIKDPLTHLVRNAVDHGIESPEFRAQQGKSPKGRLMLRAAHEGGQVNIDIEDDGSGIDVQRVKQRALERGIIDHQQAQLMSDQELVQLIFRAGFSTAEQVTDISGRGVGMDVVRTNVEKIRGTISVQNRPGEGTTVRITIPLTLAIIPALIVKTGQHRFAIPQVSLIELLSYPAAESSQQVEWVHDAPVYRLRGHLLPLVYLSQLLELERAPAVAPAGKIVVLQAEGCRFGLVVDKVINTEEIVVKALSPMLKPVTVFAGATIMGDGAVALIVDVMGLARQAELSVAKQVAAPPVEEPAAPVTTLPYLLCESDDDRRVAMRLSEVYRLERIAPGQVERAASTEVTQYGGKIIPLVRLSSLLGWPEQRASQDEPLCVVIHRQSASEAGLMVPRIVDIVDGPQQLERHGQYRHGSIVVGSSLFAGRVTDVIDLPEAMREVHSDNFEKAGEPT